MNGQRESRSARDATTAVRERPLLMSGPMVRAILDGTKTQTRRVVLRGQQGLPCPYGQSGDRLWVRETHAILDMRPEVLEYPDAVAPTKPWPASITYVADDSEREVAGLAPSDWRESYDADHVIARPSIHMPRWASRLALELTGVRVERVQDISEADAIAEGAPAETSDLAGYSPHKSGYAYLWQTLNGKRGYGWDVNPWVWVLDFRRVTP